MKNSKKNAAAGSQRKGPGSVRIIAGTWRGRRLPIADVEGLRPSGDRSRETLFNWLQPGLRGSRCVDLFAGTGALGFEARSRGASEVVLLELSHVAADMLMKNADRLQASAVQVIQTDALAWLKSQPPHAMDLVFVDPPFGKGLAQAALNQLVAGEHVACGGLVYLETARNESVTLPTQGWQLQKEKLIGEVRMQLLRRD